MNKPIYLSLPVYKYSKGISDYIQFSEYGKTL